MAAAQHMTMTRTADLEGVYRNSLSRRWATYGPKAVFIALNPSTADAAVDDPTSRQVLPPLLLDEDEAIADEAIALTLALSATELDGRGVHAEEALRAIAKLEDVTPAVTRQRMETVPEAITPAWRRASTPTCSSPGADAVRSSTRPTFTDTDRVGARTSRTVEPHRLLARGRRWRLLADSTATTGAPSDSTACPTRPSARGGSPRAASHRPDLPTTETRARRPEVRAWVRT